MGLICLLLFFSIWFSLEWSGPHPGADEMLRRGLITLDMGSMPVVSVSVSGLPWLIAPSASSVPRCRLLALSSLSCLQPTRRLDGHHQSSQPLVLTFHTSPRSL